MTQITTALIYLFAGLVARAQMISCPLMGYFPEEQTGKNNYVIDTFTEALAFPYALNQCTAVSLYSTGQWYKYTCSTVNGAWTVTKTQYSDMNCTKSETTIGHWVEGESQEGVIGFFECTGLNSYAKLTMSPNSSCANPQIIYGGLGGCTTNGPLQTELYCDDQQALIQLYVDLIIPPQNESFSSSSYFPDHTLITRCDPDLYCDKWYFSPSSCTFVANLFNFKIYGKMESCVTTQSTNGRATDSPKEKSSASSIFILSNFFIALIVTLFSLI